MAALAAAFDGADLALFRRLLDEKPMCLNGLAQGCPRGSVGGLSAALWAVQPPDRPHWLPGGGGGRVKSLQIETERNPQIIGKYL